MQIKRKEDLVQGLILGGFVLLIFHLIVTGSIVLYISSKLIWLSKLAAVLLIGMSMAKLLPKRHIHNHSCCDHGHACSSGHHDNLHSINYLQIAVFLIPLVLGFAMQPRVLGATALANSINTAGPVPFYAVSSSKNVADILSPSSKATVNNAKATNSVESIPVNSSSTTSGKQNATNDTSTANKQSTSNDTSAANKQSTTSNTSTANKQSTSSNTSTANKQSTSNNTSAANKQSTTGNTSAANKQTDTNKPNVTNKASTANSQNSSGSQPSNKPSQPVNSVTKDTDLVDLALKIYDHPDQAYDQHWRLTCFVYKDPKLAKNQFVMTRVVIACCVADATPIGIIAETPDALNFKVDTWLEVEGVLQKRIVKDADKIQPVSNLQAAEDGTPYFVVKSWKKVSAPKDPYLVPPM